MNIIEKGVINLIRGTFVSSNGNSVSVNKGASFLAPVIFDYKISRDDSVGTIGIDVVGKRLVYNESFIEKNSKYIAGILLHEIMHIITRINTMLEKTGIDLNNNLMNIAEDIVINNALVRSNIGLPKEGIIPVDNKIKIGGIEIKDIDKKTAYEIYLELMKGEKEVSNAVSMDGDGTGNGEGNSKDKRSKDKIKTDRGIISIDMSNSNVISEAISKISSCIADALSEGERTKGSMHSDPIAQLLGMIRLKKIDIKQRVLEKIRAIARAKFIKHTSNPRKRPYCMGMYERSIKKKGIKGITVIDISGSMDRELINKGLNVLYDMIKAFGGELWIKTYDTRLCEERKVKSPKDIANITMGFSGGGTEIAKMIKELKANKDYNLKVLVTDMLDDVKDEEYKDIDILITDNERALGMDNAVVIT